MISVKMKILDALAIIREKMWGENVKHFSKPGLFYFLGFLVSEIFSPNTSVDV